MSPAGTTCAPDRRAPPRTLVVGCGALGRELVELIRLNRWTHVTLTCLPAGWHNTPQKIAPGVRAKIRAGKAEGFERVLVAYGDCGTGGLLDQVLAEEGATRIGGDHCYAFFRGVQAFNEDFERDPTSFYLTDYLARHFDRLILQDLGIARHPELLEAYFGHYSSLTYLAQTDDPALDAAAEKAAATLGLAYRRVKTGYGELATFLAAT
jgi:hypothetical protein